MSHDALPADSSEEYEYEYVTVDEDGNVVDAEGLGDAGELLEEGGEVEYVVEYVEGDADASLEDGEYYEEVVYEEEVVEGDVDALEGDVEVEYEYVTVDEDGAVVETETVAESAAPATAAAIPSIAPQQIARAPRRDAGYDEIPATTREVPAWVTSLVVHLGGLSALALMSIALPVPEKIPPITSVVEELTPEDYKFDETIVDQIGSDSQQNIVSPSQQSATRVGIEPQEMVQELVNESFDLTDVPPPVEIIEPHSSEFVSQMDLNGATEHVGGTEGALDRLAIEIATSVKENKTLVVLLFDASQSLTKQRSEIADRFENVYKQVGLLDVEKNEKVLKTAVMSYGQGVNLLTEEPVDHASQVADAIRNIQEDTSGKEFVFSAVDVALTKFRQYRTAMRRNLLFVIVTDERGDDYLQVEDTIKDCRRLGAKVYVVGPASIFGREESYVDWTYEDGYTEELPVDGGPESLVPQRLKLGFWGGGGRKFDRMSAGYGPYALTRLAAETGGMYLINKDTRGQRFDPNVMKAYAPDYRPIAEYMQSMQQNSAKRFLVEAVRQTEAQDVFFPRTNFNANNDNILRQQITEAQKPAAVFEARIQRMVTLLEQGERDRDKLDTQRWRAAYDLAMGRVLAMQARSYGYNKVLADMKSVPLSFEKPGSNAWRIVPSKDAEGGASVRKLVERAQEYLSRVVDEHPGTPFALLAKQELSIPMGWGWQEYEVSMPSRNGNGNNNNGNNIMLAEEEKERQMMMQKQKAMRKKPNL